MWSRIKEIMLSFDIENNTLEITQNGELDTDKDIDKLLQFIARFESIINSVGFYNCDIELIEFIGNLHPEWRATGC